LLRSMRHSHSSKSPTRWYAPSIWSMRT